ncbi:hypothetical protein ACSSS7_001081 [Eimeria intestinalis]
MLNTAIAFLSNLASAPAESVHPEEKKSVEARSIKALDIEVPWLDAAATRSTSESTTQIAHPAATQDELPIGEATPSGEHVRSLRVFSYGGEAGSRSSREVQVLRIFKDPDVCVAPDLISKSQCEHLLQLAEGKWTRSKTSIGMVTAPQAEYTTTESKTRTSKSVMLQEAQTPGVLSVELLASALAQMPLQNLEGLVLVKYDEGDFFNEHHDGAFRPKTVLLYLNDVEDGGYTHFTRLGLQIAPAAGCGAVWGNVTPSGCMDTRTLHAGVPPKKGTKYVVNCFFNEAVVRFEQPEAPLGLPALESGKKSEQDEAEAKEGNGEKENELNNVVCNSNAPLLTPRTLLYQRREHTEHQLYIHRSAAPAPALPPPPSIHFAQQQQQQQQQSHQQQPFPASASALQRQAWGAAAVLQLSRHLNAVKAAGSPNNLQVPFAPVQPPFMMSAPPSPFRINWLSPPPPYLPMSGSFGPAGATATVGPLLVSGPSPPAV